MFPVDQMIVTVSIKLSILLSLHCLFNSLFWLTSKETPNVLITGALRVESTDDRWFSSHRASSANNVSISRYTTGKNMEYLDSVMGTVAFDILICWRWHYVTGTQKKQINSSLPGVSFINMDLIAAWLSNHMSLDTLLILSQAAPLKFGNG